MLVSCHPSKKLLYICLARTVSNIPLLLCPGTLVIQLTLIGVFLFPIHPCVPTVWADACQLPGALLLEHLLDQWAPRHAARTWQELQAVNVLLVLIWNEVTQLESLEMMPEGRTEDLWDSKEQIWCKIPQMERFDFSFTAWMLHLPAIQAPIYSFEDLLLSQQLCGFL